MNNTELIARLRTDPIFDNSTLGNEAANALEAAQPKEPMVTPYINQSHFDRAFPDTAAQPAGEVVAFAQEDAFDSLRKNHSETVLKVTKKAHPEYGFTKALYTHSTPQVPMTEDEAHQLWDAINKTAVSPTDKGLDLVRATEAHHKIGVKP